jgi:DNA polymerase (family 10)
MSLNTELSRLFQTFAALMEIKGESAFKAIAFSKVSRILKDATMDLRQAVAQGKLKEIEGIGPSSQRIIEEYVKTGRSSDFDEVATSVPPGLLPMLEIPGLGPKTIALLWKERKITTLDELKLALNGNALEGLKGIGEKKIESIKQGIALHAQAGQRIGIVEALPLGDELLQGLRKLPSVAKAEVAGSLRRRAETIGDLDLVCALKDPSTAAAVGQAFIGFAPVQKILGQGETKVSILTAAGLQVDLRIVPLENFGAALQYFTGSKHHNTKLRGLALDKEMTLNEWGLYRLKDYDRAKKETGRPPQAKPVASKSEEEIYEALGLAWIDPMLREDRGEIEAAGERRLPNLINLKDIRGDLHSHTTASDGQAGIEQMAEAALARGYEFLAITDHSKSQVIANGLTAERLIKHIAQIHRVSEKLKGITLLAGCEVDILADGRLDFEDAVLAELDFVVASPHISLKQDSEKATERLLRAIENRYVNVIGHPTGRLIHEREGLSPDFGRLFSVAAQSGTVMEINSGYPRLDLNDTNARAALAAGVKLSVNTDAHSIDGLDEMQYGIHVARRAWATKGDVINCMSIKQLREMVVKKRG